MSDPTRYQPSYDFTDFQSGNPVSPLPAQQVDIQLDAIADSTTSLRDAVMDVRRSDGALKNGIVTPDSLAASLSIGFTLRGAWTAGTSYAAGDGVVYSGVFYKCLVANVAATGHEPGVDTSLWAFLVSISSVSIGDGSVTPAKLAAGDEAAFQAIIGTGGQLGPLTDALTGKTTPADADELAMADSASSSASKKITFANIAAGIWTRLGALIAGGTGKTTPVGADMLPIADSAASNATKFVTLTNFFAAVFTGLGAAIAGGTGKTTPVGADMIVVADSAASNASKFVTLTNLWTSIFTAFGGLISAGTAKTTPVDADAIVLMDSAASNASKKVTWANVYTAALAALSTSGVLNGVLDLSGSGAGQIKFPVTQHSSSNANTNDDYEEGTYTPGITFGGGNTGLTTSVATGNYTKNGRNVSTIGFVTLSAKGSSSGAAAQSGLPFGVQGGIPTPFLPITGAMTSLTGAVKGDATSGGGTAITLKQSGSAGDSTISDTSFTSTSTVEIAGNYSTST